MIRLDILELALVITYKVWDSDIFMAVFGCYFLFRLSREFQLISLSWMKKTREVSNQKNIINSYDLVGHDTSTSMDSFFLFIIHGYVLMHNQKS